MESVILRCHIVLTTKVAANYRFPCTTSAIYNSKEGYHLLKTNGCRPFIYQKYSSEYHSDITAVLDVQKPILVKFTLPEYSYTAEDVYISNATRLSTQQKRDSINRHCELKPHSETYDDKANLLATSFTCSVNTILSKYGHQTTNKTPTKAIQILQLT